MLRSTRDASRVYHVIFALLLLPALLVNLDAHHIFIHTDEGRRALVALEMILKQEYLAPTLNGIYYFEKPPLFNWLLVLSFKAFGAYSLFALRFPVVIFVLAFAWSIVYFLKPILGKQKAWIVMAATICSGRILFYDSFLGLMDIGLGVLVFINFMLFFKLGTQRRYLLLFVATYSITAVGYLMKGLPSVVFQFFTLVAWAAYARDWKFLFHKYNFLGTLFFIVPVGFYYFFYQKVNPDSLATIVEYTIHQSSQRTVTDYGIWPTVRSIFTFPFENLYHFAPWTLLLFSLFSKKVRSTIWSNDFLRFAILAIALNIWVYWTSPGNQPRYLFMFLPLIFAIAVEGYFAVKEGARRMIDYVFLIAMVAIALTLPALIFFADKVPLPEYAALKGAITFLGLLVFIALFWKKPAERLIILGIFLLVVRLGFNWFVLPFKSEKARQWAEDAVRVVEIVQDEPTYVLAPRYCHDGTSFIISSMRGEVLEVRSTAEAGVYYLIDSQSFDAERFDAILEFGTEGTDLNLVLSRLK